MNNDPTIALTKALIEQASVSPDDAGCQQLLIEQLAPLGFDCQTLVFEDVTNLWARYGNTGPLFVFAGHTDVVPAGDLAAWSTPPFTPTIKDGQLFGRGAADMKSAVAAMTLAAGRFVRQHPEFPGSIALLITSDEEATAEYGTKAVVSQFKSQGIHFDYCVVGEPSAVTTLGDTMKIGRRGSLSGRLTVSGLQHHIAYPQAGKNPIHRILPALHELAARQWDKACEDFAATSLQCSNFHAGTGANNVIPASATVDFNFRYHPQTSADWLMQQTLAILDAHELDYDIAWRHSGTPYHTRDKAFIQACQAAIESVCQQSPALSTSGGTSDGRFIADICSRIVEIGVSNATIHQVDECVTVSAIPSLTDLYNAILTRCLLS